MGKNMEMLKCFFGVMSKKNEDIVIPNMYAKDVYSIDYDYFLDRKLEYLIFDIDNTILPVNDIKVSKRLIELFDRLSNDDFKILILSNNNKERVVPVASKLKVDYLFKAGKPEAISFDRALDILKAKKENAVMIGDQMLSDIKGANEYGIYSVLVDPVSNKYDIKTGTSRILQNIMTKRLEKRKIFKIGNYYIKEER